MPAAVDAGTIAGQRPVNSRGSAIILLYHSITQAPLDPWGLRVDPPAFAEHMRWLRERTNPIRLCDVDGLLRGEAVPPRSVAVTFDDGYADNLLAAAPILKKHGLPATMFIATGYIGGHSEYWWDDLERIALRPAASVRTLTANINGRETSWRVDEPLHKRLLGRRRLARWRAWQTDQLTARQSTLLQLWELLREFEPEARDALLEQLRTQAGHDRAPRSTHRPMTQSELHELARCEHIEIGAHTHRHPALALLNPSQQQHEIQRSRRWLEDELQRPITSFALPFGTPADYSQTTLELVRGAGFERCVTTQPRPVDSAANRFALPRFNVSNWPLEEFAARLEQWFAQSAAAHH